MFVGVLFSIIVFLMVSAKYNVVAETPNLNGYYYMPLPLKNASQGQFAFNIDWSDTLNRYLVVATGQSLSWTTGQIDFIDNTTINLACDNGNNYRGIITYPTDLPSICWPTVKEFTCWNRLLSNITRIHVINM